MSRCKADPVSANPGSSDMVEQGGGGQRPSRIPIKQDVGVVQMVKSMGGGEGDAVREICVGGCIRPSKVCEGCNVQQAGLAGRCWGGGSKGLGV